MKSLHPIFSTTCLALLFPFWVILGANSLPHHGIDSATPASQAGGMLQITATLTTTASVPSLFKISLAELGYDEKTLSGSYGTTEYTLRLPEGWRLHEESYLDLDVSYAYNSVLEFVPTPTSPGPATQPGAAQGAITPTTQAPPARLGDIIVTVDGQTQLIFPINSSTLEHEHLNVALPPSLLNDSARSVHNIKVSLDAGLICNIPHKARLTIHPSSYFSLSYDRLPITADLARFPRPFYQQAFEPDQVGFILPASPTRSELGGAMAMAAKLGNITPRMVISGTTDVDLMSRIKANDPPQEHLFVIGRPENNQVILEFNRLGVLPISLQERKLNLASEGPAMVVPGDDLTYTLAVTNTLPETVSALSLIDTLPPEAQVVSCSPVCSQTAKGEVTWSIPSLKAGEAVRYALKLNLNQVFSDTIVENTVTLLNATSNPLNVNTLTATLSSTPQPISGLTARVSNENGYFFAQGGRAVPESDGIVQEIVSPWDQTRAILVITGLDDEAVYKASWAMSSDSHFPGMEGAAALVRELHPRLESPTELSATDQSFAELGYDDKTMQGVSQDISYYFDIPLGWQLTEKAYLDLHFSHSQLVDYTRSFLNVLLNNQPIASIPLNDATSSLGDSRVPLLSSASLSGQRNKISIQVEMHPINDCGNPTMWLTISRASMLHLDHSQQGNPSLNLDLYPYPFDRQPNLADVLFVLPSQPSSEEWIESLQLAATLGRAAGGTSFAPALALGNTWPEATWGNYHLIAIGRPSRNPVLQQVNAQLPQPFLPGSDVIEQKLNDVTLRLPPEIDLGYLQLLPSPWNEERAFLAVTGTSARGVGWATWLLTNRPGDAGGNLTMVRGEQVNKIDTRLLTHAGLSAKVSTAVPELTPVAATSSTPAAIASAATPASQLVPTSAPQDRSETTGPTWLIPLVAATLVAVLGMFAFAVWQARRR